MAVVRDDCHRFPVFDQSRICAVNRNTSNANQLLSETKCVSICALCHRLRNPSSVRRANKVRNGPRIQPVLSTFTQYSIAVCSLIEEPSVVIVISIAEEGVGLYVPVKCSSSRSKVLEIFVQLTS